MLLRVITEHAEHRSKKWTGTTTELHELTGATRKTISTYLDVLTAKGLLIQLQKAHGSRPGLLDVSRFYDDLILPNNEQPQAAANKKAASSGEQASDTDCVSSASSLSQMTRPTRGNTDLGGMEAIEEEKVQDSQSGVNGLRGFYEAAAERWRGTKIQDALDAAIKEHGLDPLGCWWVDAETNGTGDELRERLESVAAGYKEF